MPLHHQGNPLFPRQDPRPAASLLDEPHHTQGEHEQHGPMTLTPGLWLAERQREYRPKAKRTVTE